MSQYELLSYEMLFTKGVRNQYADKVRFNDLGFKNIISCIASEKLNNFSSTTDEVYKKNLENIIKGSYSLVDYSRKYVNLYYDKVLKDKFKKELNYLLEKPYLNDFESVFFDDELDDFISEYVVDEINLVRTMHYDKVCFSLLSEDVFEKIPEIELRSLFNKLTPSKTSSVNNDIHNLLMKTLKFSNGEFDKRIHVLLLRLFDFKYNNNKISEGTLLLAGLDLRENNLFYSRKMSIIKNTVKKVIDKGLNKSKKIKI